MSFDMEQLEPQLKEWFYSEVEIQGRAIAEFEQDGLRVEGPAIVRFDAANQPVVRMNVEFDKVQIADPDRPNLMEPPAAGLMEFLSGQRRVREGNQVSFVISGGGAPLWKNRCVRLVVETPEGVYTAVKGIRYGYSVEQLNTGVLSFVAPQMQFDTSLYLEAQATPAKADHPAARSAQRQPLWWVLPLHNFMSDFPPREHSLDKHPLRLFPTPDIPQGLMGAEAELAKQIANQRNGLIPFEFRGRPGFIEPLPEYKERVQALERGAAPFLLTALMIGEVPWDPLDYDDVKSWFPFDYLPLLSFITGTEVGAPWIEFRDSASNLLRRFHIRFGNPMFSQGTRLVQEAADRGTGLLLSEAPNSPEFASSHLRVTMKQLVKAGTYSRPLEDNLTHLFRALDTLCTVYDLYPSLRASEELNAENARALDAVIREARSNVEALVGEARQNGNIEDATLLGQVAERITTAAVITVGFNKAVANLLDKLQLPDAGIMNSYYRANRRPDGKKRWVDVLAAYRGTAVHKGYFDIVNLDEVDEERLSDIVTVMRHLHDVVARIVFKVLGYTGTYQPVMQTMTVAGMTPDWVTATTRPEQLGYRA